MRSTNLLFLAFALVLTGCGSEGSNTGNSAPIPSLRTAEPRYQLANQCFIARHQGSGLKVKSDFNIRAHKLSKIRLDVDFQKISLSRLRIKIH
jgi:hypothetical protein